MHERVWIRAPDWLVQLLDESAEAADRSRAAEMRIRLARDLKQYPPGVPTPAQEPGETED